MDKEYTHKGILTATYGTSHAYHGMKVRLRETKLYWVSELHDGSVRFMKSSGDPSNVNFVGFRLKLVSVEIGNG